MLISQEQGTTRLSKEGLEQPSSEMEQVKTPVLISRGITPVRATALLPGQHREICLFKDKKIE